MINNLKNCNNNLQKSDKNSLDGFCKDKLAAPSIQPNNKGRQYTNNTNKT